MHTYSGKEKKTIIFMGILTQLDTFKGFIYIFQLDSIYFALTPASTSSTLAVS